MSGSTPPPDKNVSPIRHNEKPWDQWAAEIGRASPLRDDDPALDPTKGTPGRRPSDSPRKRQERTGPGRCGVTRLRRGSMNLYGQFPNADMLNAAVCHMCGMTVKCSAAHRHLSEYHSSGSTPILPPPPPAPTVKLKSSHSKSKCKKELPPPPAPLPEPERPVLPAVPTFPEEIRPAAAAVVPVPVVARREIEPDRFPEVDTAPSLRSGEVEVSVGDDDPPVVSIRESADLPLGDGLADDIMEIMNSEGIRSIEDLPDAAAWKNLMQDFGAVREIDLRNVAPIVEALPAPNPVYSLGGESTAVRFAAPAEPAAVDRRRSPFPTPNPVSAPVKPRSGTSGKSSRPKHPAREYDPNRHCGVPSGESRNPCTRSLTCKSHALSLRRLVEGRAKQFDALLAEHRASKPTAQAGPPQIPAPCRPIILPVPAPEPPPPPIRMPVEQPFVSLSPDRQAVDYFSAVVSIPGDPPATVIPEEPDLISLLPLDVAEALVAPPMPLPSPPRPPEPRPQHVYWYPTEPRPLAACGFSACRMGGALFLGRRLATVRNDLKAALSRSRSDDAGNDFFNFTQNSVPSVTKNVHANSSAKTAAPQVRKLVMSCPTFSGSGADRSAYYGTGKRNGHLFSVKRPLLDDYDNGEAECLRGNSVTKVTKRAPPGDMMDLNFMFDPLMADEKC